MRTEHQQKWIQAIVKLNRLTQENKLKWQPNPPPEPLQDIKVDVVYVTCFKGMKLRLYELRYTDELDFLPIASISPRIFERLSSLFGKPKSEWTTRTVLELMNPADDYIVWQVPRVEGLDDLLKAVRYQNNANVVRYQTADVEGFLNELLKDE